MVKESDRVSLLSSDIFRYQYCGSVLGTIV